MLITTAKKTRLSLPNKTSLGIYTGSGGVAGFTRATTKTCRGYLENALPGDPQYIFTIPSGVPCFPGLRFIASDNTWSDIYSDGNPIDEASLGVLIEPESTNLITHSNAFNSTNYSTGYDGGYFIENATIAPDGTLTASKLVMNDNAVNVFFAKYNKQTIDVVSGSYYTLSCFLKPGEVINQIDLIGDIRDGGGLTGFAKFSLSGAGSVTQCTAVSAKIKKIDSSDWFFCQVLFLCDSSQTEEPGLRVYGYSNPGVAKGFYAWGFKLENNRFSTSQITTTSSTVTCNADIQTIQTAQNINRYQGSLSFNFTPTHNAVGTVALGGSKQDDNNYVEIIQTAGTGYIFRKCISGINYDATLAGDFVADTTYTVKIKWSSYSGTEIFVNGVKGVNNPNTAPLPLGSVWYVGADKNGANQAGACFKNVLTKYK